MGNWEWFTKFHRAVYRRSGGRLGAKLMGLHMVLLTTTGRKSGRPRTIPLACFPDIDSAAAKRARPITADARAVATIVK